MKLTPRVQKVICDAIEAGHYNEAAAEAAGIARRTLYAWLDRGAKLPPQEVDEIFRRLVMHGVAAELGLRSAKAAAERS